MLTRNSAIPRRPKGERRAIRQRPPSHPRRGSARCLEAGGGAQGPVEWVVRYPDQRLSAGSNQWICSIDSVAGGICQACQVIAAEGRADEMYGVKQERQSDYARLRRSL